MKEYMFEYVEYFEDNHEEIFRISINKDQMVIAEGEKSKTIFERGTELLTFEGIVENRFHFVLYKEVYEYSFRVNKDILLDEEKPLFDERLSENYQNRWIRISLRLIVK